MNHTTSDSGQPPRPSSRAQTESALGLAAQKNRRDTDPDGNPAPKAAGEALQDYPLSFHGSGSEYFRIWIVNLLLIFVTFGLYLPWAKVRKLRYFYSNTELNGQPFDFHGEPAKMLRGMLFAGFFLGVYSKALEISYVAWLVAVAAMIALWPLLFRASMQFRLANTSWQGLRFRFLGDKGGAYRSVGVALACVLLPFGFLQWRAVKFQELGRNTSLLVWPYVLFGVFLIVVLPWLFWRIKRYQHIHYAYGNQQTEWRSSAGDMYKLVFKTMFFVFGLCASFFLLLMLLFFLGMISDPRHGDNPKAMAAIFAAIGLFVMLFMFVFNVVVRSYWLVGVQNLVWSRTGNSRLRLISRLKFGPYCQLQLGNYLLILVTLGLYWPFAVIRSRRMQIESMVLRTRGLSLDDLYTEAATVQGEAVGDMAADLYGMDVGL